MWLSIGFHIFWSSLAVSQTIPQTLVSNNNHLLSPIILWMGQTAGLPVAGPAVMWDLGWVRTFKITHFSNPFTWLSLVGTLVWLGGGCCLSPRDLSSTWEGSPTSYIASPSSPKHKSKSHFQRFRSQSDILHHFCHTWLVKASLGWAQVQRGRGLCEDIGRHGSPKAIMETS